MEFQSYLILSDEIRRTMRVMPRDQSEVELSRQPVQVRKPQPERSSRLGGYFERHKDFDLVTCQSADGIALVFCPSDHTGVWTGQVVKGVLGARTQTILEKIAKDKCLI
jgi:hypothetical protein